MPSSELGLMNPAASPTRYAPCRPVSKLRGPVGRSTTHASVRTGFSRSNPKR